MYNQASMLRYCLHAGAQLLCQAEASRGVGQQAKPTVKREQAVAGTTAAIAPRAAVPPTATAARSTHAAGPDPSSYSSVMAGTSYSKLGKSRLAELPAAACQVALLDSLDVSAATICIVQLPSSCQPCLSFWQSPCMLSASQQRGGRSKPRSRHSSCQAAESATLAHISCQ